MCLHLYSAQNTSLRCNFCFTNPLLNAVCLLVCISTHAGSISLLAKVSSGIQTQLDCWCLVSERTDQLLQDFFYQMWIS